MPVSPADGPASRSGGKKLQEIREMEQKMQAWWATAPRMFEESEPDTRPAYLVTFPMPYMNGRLHLGHMFTFSKAEFAAGYHRMLGERVVLPFAFHATGMPICSAADRLKRELAPIADMLTEMASTESEEQTAKTLMESEEQTAKTLMESEEQTAKTLMESEEQTAMTPMESEAQTATTPTGPLPTIPRSRHSKALAKTDTQLTTQSAILISSGVPPELVPQFVEPHYWLEYFPGLAVQDLTAFGAGVAWGRSFLTAALNPYYDRFVRWQFLRLRAAGKIKFGKRRTIYSRRDGGPCLDHDRQSGEGVMPIVVRVRRTNLDAGQRIRPGAAVELWVAEPLPDDVAARHVDHDLHLFAVPMKGGAPTRYVLAPPYLLDNATAQNLIPKLFAVNDDMITHTPPEWGDYGIKDLGPVDHSMFDEFNKYAWDEPMSTCDVPTCDEPKSTCDVPKSTCDVPTSNVPTCDEPKSTCDVPNTPLFHLAIPTTLVISRSGEACIVAELDQYYIDYGEPTWRAEARTCILNMSGIEDDTRALLLSKLDWMQQWACTRSYGLGSRLPWDPAHLIESLSDSTAYMAYYAIAPLLHRDLFGRDPVVQANGAILRPEHLVPELFDLIFTTARDPIHELPAAIPASISTALVTDMRTAFQTLYPVDLRVSGKDLANNHLVQYIYAHVALFDPAFWPRAIQLNGHLLLNKAKMAKSTGNFITLADGLRAFGADAMRLGLADAGDRIDDANFSTEAANAAVLRLHAQIAWAEGLGLDDHAVATCDLLGEIFRSRMAQQIQRTRRAYAAAHYKQALKAGFYDLQNARDEYLDALRTLARAPDPHLLRVFLQLQALLIAPIGPHFAEHLWRNVLGECESIRYAPFPDVRSGAIYPPPRFLGRDQPLVLDAPRDELVGPYCQLLTCLRRWKRQRDGLIRQGRTPPTRATLKIAVSDPAWLVELKAFAERVAADRGTQHVPTELRAHAIYRTQIKRALGALHLATDQDFGSQNPQRTIRWHGPLDILRRDPIETLLRRALGLQELRFECIANEECDRAEELPAKLDARALPGAPIILFE